MKKYFKFFIKYIFPLFFFLISLSLLLIVIYKSEIIFKGIQRDYYFQYYFITIVLFLISIITIFSNQKIRLNLFIILFSITFTVYSIELFLLNFNQNDKVVENKKKLFSKLGLEYDDRSKLQIFEDLKKINKKYVITVPPNNYLKKKTEIFPLSGISNSPTIFCNENGYYSTYTSDRYGFNNIDKTWDQESVEYLIVGDSFAQGACVNKPNDFTSVLSKISNKNALNLGYGGNGPLSEYASLKEYMKLKKFNNVIWLFYPNDLDDLKHEYQNNFLRKYFEDYDFNQNLHLKQNIIDEMAINEIQETIKLSVNKNKSKISSAVKLSYLRKTIQYKSNKIDNNLKQIIFLANKFSNERKANFYFVYLPSFGELNLKNNLETYSNIKTLIEDLRINFIDIYQFVKDNENYLEFFPLKMQGHYNEKGYEVIGKKIYEEISNF